MNVEDRSLHDNSINWIENTHSGSFSKTNSSNSRTMLNPFGAITTVKQFVLSGYCRGKPGLHRDILGLSLVKIIVLLQPVAHSVFTSGSAKNRLAYYCENLLINETFYRLTLVAHIKMNFRHYNLYRSTWTLEIVEFYFSHVHQVVLEMIFLVLHNPVRLNHRHSAVYCSCCARTNQGTNLFKKIKRKPHCHCH